MADSSVQARTRNNVLLRTLDVRQILRKVSGEEEGIRNVEQHFNCINQAASDHPSFGEWHDPSASRGLTREYASRLSDRLGREALFPKHSARRELGHKPPVETDAH